MMQNALSLYTDSHFFCCWR